MDRNILLNKTVKIENKNGSKYEGEIAFMDDIGLFFVPNDLTLNSCYAMWHNIVRVHMIE